MANNYSLAPWLNVKNSIEALAFYKAAFDAREVYRLDFPDGLIARLSVNGAEFWIGDESPEHGNHGPGSLNATTVRLILSVDDPDNVFERAVNAGATIVNPVEESHGWRVGRVVDPFGHHWEIGKMV